MIDLRRAKHAAQNQWLRRNGRLLNYFHGTNILGPQQPAECFPLPPFSGYAPIFTDVVDCPYSTDDAGISFPTSTSYCVRTRTWVDLDGGGGVRDPRDEFAPLAEWLTMVPRIPGGAYTQRGMDFLTADGTNYHDCLGDCPLGTTGGATDSRSPFNVALPTARRWDYKSGYEWWPMNLSRLYISAAIGTSPFYTVSPNSFYTAVKVADNHIGFRGVKVEHYGNSGYTYNYYVTAETVGVTPSAAPPASPVWTAGPQTGSGATINFTSSASIYPAGLDGTKHDYWFWTLESYTSPIGSGSGGTASCGPRVDVPLHYTAVGGNRIALGGIILP